MSIKQLVTMAAQVYGWIEILIPMIPMFTELLMELLQNCANDELEAQELLLSADERQLKWMHAKVCRRAWVKSQAFRRMDREEREQAVWESMYSVQATVAANREKIPQLYGEAKAAKPVSASTSA